MMFEVFCWGSNNNEGESRSTIVGFEAPIAGFDADYNGYFTHPYDLKKLKDEEKKAIESQKYVAGFQDYGGIKDFSVMVNGGKVDYKIVRLDNLRNPADEESYSAYLYHFHALLQKGINHIKHKYRLISQGSVLTRYELEYILGTASRWKGGKINDFTLKLNMKPFEEFRLENRFFDNLKYWSVPNGMVMIENATVPDDYTTTVAHFYLRDGKAVFHKKNFLPKSVVYLYSNLDSYSSIFDHKRDELPFNIKYNPEKPSAGIFFANDKLSLKVLKALPMARRGAVFEDDSVANYYRQFAWYSPKKKDQTTPPLTTYELGHLKEIEKLKLKILRNLPFAKSNYKFRDERLELYFKQFKWYKPNPKIKGDLNVLDDYGRAFRANILKLKAVSDADFFKYQKEFLNEK